MIIYDNIDVQLSYEIESAITQLTENIALNNIQYDKMISNQALLESQIYSSTLILNEGVKESIIEFLKKVTAAVSKAWTAFKNFQNTQTIELMNKNKDKLTSDYKMYCPDNFEIPKVNDNNWETFNENIQIKDFVSNYETWKQQKVFESVDQFIKSQYPELLKSDMNLVQSMHKDMFMDTAQTKGKAITAETLTPFINFINNFVTTRDNIGKDIDSLNASNKNIEAMLSKIIAEHTDYIGYNIFSLLSEADQVSQTSTQQAAAQNTSNNQNNNTNKFRSADPNDQQSDDNKKKLAEDRKNIVTYYKASTQVFSAKLKTCKAIETACEKIVSNFIKLQLKGSKKKEEQPQQASAQVNNQQSTTIQN